MKAKKRFQIIKQLISAQNTEYSISAETDKNYEHVTGICAYANPIYASNNNLVIASALKIDNEELFPADFDTALLFPIEDNKVFREIKANADGSKLEVTVKDKASVATPYYFYIVLTLESNEK